MPFVNRPDARIWWDQSGTGDPILLIMGHAYGADMWHRTAPELAAYDPADPMGKMFFNILATFAELEVDLLKLRTREGMAVAKSKGKLRGKQPKLSARQQAGLLRMRSTGEYTIADLMEVFSVGRATVYRVVDRAKLDGAA